MSNLGQFLLLYPQLKVLDYHPALLAHSDYSGGLPGGLVKKFVEEQAQTHLRDRWQYFFAENLNERFLF